MAEKMGKRPKLKLKLSATEKLVEVAAFASLISIIFFTLFYWGRLPERIPTHFNFTGQPDAYGGKVSILFIPVVITFLYALLTILSSFPHAFNYMYEITEENAKRQYESARSMMCWLKLETVLLFAYIQLSIIRSVSGAAKGLGFWFLPVVIIAVFGTIAYFIYKSIRLK
jgi:uncharacterized membrane protein